MYCPKCGQAVQIVPEYSILEDVMDSSLNSLRLEGTPPQPEVGQDGTVQKKGKGQWGRKLRYISCFAFIAALAGVALLWAIAGRNHDSYPYNLSKAGECLDRGDTEQSVSFAKRALELSPDSLEAGKLLALAYRTQGERELATEQYESVLDKGGGDTEVYEALLSLYEESQEEEKILALKERTTDQGLLELFAGYVADAPVFGLESGTYTESLSLSIEAPGSDEIYYTVDNTAPTRDSIPYRGSIRLKDGKNVIRAIAVSEKGIASKETTGTYQISPQSLGMAHITPSSGTYTGAAQIEITVPEGCAAYYTWDGTRPTAQSACYTGPVDMIDGNNIFSVILIDGNGQEGLVSRRNYILGVP